MSISFSGISRSSRSKIAVRGGKPNIIIGYLPKNTALGDFRIPENSREKFADFVNLLSKIFEIQLTFCLFVSLLGGGGGGGLGAAAGAQKREIN